MLVCVCNGACVCACVCVTVCVCEGCLCVHMRESACNHAMHENISKMY